MALTSDSGRIERDLDETRSRLGAHLDELQDKLSPGQVLDDLMSYFRGSEGAAFGQNLVANIRSNPMPAAITGVGLAWLMASNPRGAASPAVGVRQHHYGRDDYAATAKRVGDAELGVTRDADEPETSYTDRLNAARGQALGLAKHAQETAGSFGQRVMDALSSAQQSVTASAHDLGDKVGGAVSATSGALGGAGSSAQSAASYAGNKVSQGGQAAGQMSQNMVAALVESPVLLGALGLAAGALLGALVPRSEQEEAALGGIARQAREAATDLANRGMEGGRSVANAVVQKAKEGAQAHDMAGGSATTGQFVDAALSGKLAGNASSVAKEALKSGEEAIRKEVSKAGGTSDEAAKN